MAPVACAAPLWPMWSKFPLVPGPLSSPNQACLGSLAGVTVHFRKYVNLQRSVGYEWWSEAAATSAYDLFASWFGDFTLVPFSLGVARRMFVLLHSGLIGAFWAFFCYVKQIWSLTA